MLFDFRMFCWICATGLGGASQKIAQEGYQRAGSRSDVWGTANALETNSNDATEIYTPCMLLILLTIDIRKLPWFQFGYGVKTSDAQPKK